MSVAELAAVATAVVASAGMWVEELGCFVLELAAVGEPWTAPDTS